MNKELLINLGIVLAGWLISLFVLWGKYSAKHREVEMNIEEHCKRIADLERRMEIMNPIWSDIQSRLASIETTLKFLVNKRK